MAETRSKTFDTTMSVRQQVSPSRRRHHHPQQQGAEEQIPSLPNESSSPRDGNNSSDEILRGVAWKRRSGFGKLSGTVGVGSSWERRLFILHAPSPPASAAMRLCYYALNPPPDCAPVARGTLNLLPERATISATHFTDTAQPTPFALSIKTTDGIAPESTKWKLCFDDRRSQMAWLVALTDAVVDGSVREYNRLTLAAEADKWEPGGFHRLYEEGEGSMFDLVRDALLTGGGETGDNPEDEGDEHFAPEQQQPTQGDTQQQYVAMESFEQIAPAAVDYGGDGGPARDRTLSASSILVDDDKETRRNSLAATTKHYDDVSGYYLLQPFKLYQALAVVNISVLYAHWAAASMSCFVISWWQVLAAVNIGIYMCFAPSSSTEAKSETLEVDTTKEARREKEELIIGTEQNKTSDEMTSAATINEARPQLQTTKSMIGAELLREQEVPLSEVPMEVKEKKGAQTDKAPPAQHRLGPLSEEEMGAHKHERWAMSAPNIDLTGSWNLIADDAFKAEYDTYLKQLGFNRITRGVACSLIGRTTEITRQSDGGRELYVKGVNPKGTWERTLTASGYPDFETHSERKAGRDYKHMRRSILTADSESVNAEAWWEKLGTRHRSWLRGAKKYGGGDFESIRYLEEGSGGNVLVCESSFHPRDETKKKAEVTWRYQRDTVSTGVVSI